MICLFDNKAEKLDLIETNGDYILDPICTDAIITEELNGEYSLDADFIIDKKSHIDYDMICEDSLIKIDDEYGKEYFRIAKVTKTTRRVTIFARHITISDILTMFCEDVRPEGQTGAGAISWIFDNASGKKWFNVSSDIPTLSTAYYVNKNVYEALFTADNSFLDRWGGETYRRGFNIAINQRVGADRGVQIRSKKNLTGFEASTNINSLITRIYPKGYNGITIDEKYIDSKYINNYSSIFAKEVKFEGVKVIEEGEEGEGYKTLAEAQNELKRLVNELYEVDKVDLITASYRINFVQLEKTEEYKNYSILERTWLGDTIEVIEDTLGINITVRVLKRKYDVIKGKRIETELSNKDTKEKPPTIQQVINKIEKLPTAENVLQIAKEQATAVINAGINGYVVANKNEILIMDTPDKNTAVKVWRWNVNGLGYSSTGYYGQYGLAMTMEGQIVADFITTGVLNANLIKTGILKSFNNKTWVNMEDGTFNFADKMKFDGTNFEVDLSKEGLATEEDIGNVIFKFSNSGGDNIIENGQFLDNINSWLEYISDFNGINGNRSVITPSNEWCIDGRNCLQIKATNSTTGHYGMVQSVVLKRNCTYTLSGYNASHRCLGFILIQRSSGDYKIFEGGNLKGGIGGKNDEAWDKWSFTFTTDDGNNGYNIYLGITECGEDAYCWYTDLMLSEGSVRKAYVPNSKELYNGKTVINRDGLTVYDGGIKIKNQLNNDVMWCDSEGWLTCNKLNTYGTEAAIEIGSDSPGNKGLGIRSPNDSATLYLDFSPCVKGTDFTTIQNTGKFHRIATYGSKRDTLFLEVGAKLEIRKSKLDGLPVSMLVQGTIDSSDSISTQRNVTATGRVTAGGFSMSDGNTLIATDTISTIKYANNGGKSYLEIATPEFGTWGVDIWASDENLKENIKASKVNALEQILNINLKSYNYVDGINVENGFIAQELAKISEDLVFRIVQSDGTEILQPRASGIMPWLTKAMQEQNIYIRELENENLKLKKEVDYHSESILDSDYRLTSLELGI